MSSKIRRSQSFPDSCLQSLGEPRTVIGTSTPKLQVRSARVSEAEALSALAVASKNTWPYPKGYVQRCAAELALSPAYMERARVRVAEVGGHTVGFYALISTQCDIWLDHFWLAPGWQRLGLGRQLWHDAVAESRARSILQLKLVADPFAAGFYRKMGAVQYGRQASTMLPGCFLPLMRVALPPDQNIAVTGKNARTSQLPKNLARDKESLNVP